MKPEEVRQFAEEMAKTMKSMIEAGDEAMPIAFVHRRDGQNEAFMFELRDVESKEGTATVLRLLTARPNVEFVVFLTDAWMAAMKLGKEIDLSPYGESVKNMPGRTEVIVASIFRKGQPGEIGHWKHEGKVFAPKMEWLPWGSELTGRFVGENPEWRKA